MVEFSDKEGRLFAAFVVLVIAFGAILAVLILLPKQPGPYSELYFEPDQPVAMASLGESYNFGFVYHIFMLK